jgi:beta-lactamase regulating signal transducer with metallopeptidase domain
MTTAWIEWANSAAEAWAAAMFRATWQGGAALLVVWALCETLARRSGRAQSWLWRVGYAKFVVCLLGVTPVTLAVLPAATGERVPTAVIAPAPVGATGEMTGGGMSEDVPAVTVAPLGRFAGQVSASRDVAVGVAVAPSWKACAMGVWVMGVAIGGGRLFLAWRRTRSAIRRAVGDGTGGSFPEMVVAALGVRRVPRVMAAAVASPVLAGLWRPVVLVPAGLAGRCTAAQWRAILAHELAHLKRGDLWWNWLCAGVGMVFWFHPLVWAARRRWALAQEMACDALALRATEAGAAEYGRLLVDLVAGGLPRRALLGVGVAESAGTLRRRLVAMKTMTQWTKRYKAAVAGVIAVGAVVGVVPWRVVAQEAEGPPAPATAPSAGGGGVHAAYAYGEVKRRDDLLYLIIAQTPDHGVAERMARALAAGGVDVSVEFMRGGLLGLVSVEGFRTGADGEGLRKKVIEIGRTRPGKGWEDAYFSRVQAPNGAVFVGEGGRAAAVRSVDPDGTRTAEERERLAAVQPRLAATAPVAAQGPSFQAVVRAPTVELRAPVDGVLEAVPAAGTRVKKGDVLFRFRDREAELRVELSKARVQLAEAKARRNEAAGSQQERRESEIELQAERRVLQGDEQRVVDLQVTAPIDGVVTAHSLIPGAYVQRGSELATLVNTREPFLSFYVPVGSAQLGVGQAVTFTPGPTATYQGKITYVDPRADGGLVQVQASLQGAAEALKSGMQGSVTIQGR